VVDVPGQAVLAVLTRAPAEGGKSRLFAGLGMAPDPALLLALLRDTLDAAAVPGVRRMVAVTPPEAAADTATRLPRDVRVVAQPDGDLGARMSGVMLRLSTRGAGRVVLIGSDLPELTMTPVARAFGLLAEHPNRIVLGPARDGGYFLIGATRVPPVFAGVPWGGPEVLARTLAAAREALVPVHLLDSLADVDTPDDLRRAAAARPGSRTAAWVRARLGDGWMRGAG
jgi:rSAM/selenodomain-associated transferase 1